MPILREGGQLLSVTDETLAQRLDRQGLPQTVQPGQAAALGATPKQADMAGVPLRKKPILEAQVGKEETLMGRQRLQEARTQATADEQAAQARGEQMRLLGSLQGRVQDFVSGQFKGVSVEEGGEPTALGQGLVKQTPLEDALGFTKDTDPAAYQKAADILQKFSANASNQDVAEQALIELQAAGVDYTKAKSLLDLTSKATGQTVAANIADTVLLRDVGVEELGFDSMDEVAELLGMSAEEVGAMDMNEVSDKVDDIRQAEFTKIQGLKAELASTPVGSLQRQVLIRQLRDLGSVGVTGLEQQIKTTAEEIDTADTVQLGEYEFEVSELLDDEELSDMIQDWLVSDEDEREKMLPAAEFKGLTDWLVANEAALKDVAGDITETTEKLEEAQASYADMSKLAEGVTIGNDVLALYMDGYDPTQLISSKDLAAKKVKFGQTGLGQLVAEGDTALINKISQNTDMGVHKELAGKSAAEITAASNTGNDLKDVAGLAEWAGFTPGGFVFDANAQAKIARGKELFDKIGGKPWMSNDNFKGLDWGKQNWIADGGQTRFDQFVDWKDRRKKVTTAGSFDDIVALLGITNTEHLTVGSGKYQQAQELISLGINIDEAQAFLDKVHRLNDVNGMKSKMNEAMTENATFEQFRENSGGLVGFEHLKEDFQSFDPGSSRDKHRENRRGELERIKSNFLGEFSTSLSSFVNNPSFFPSKDKYTIPQLDNVIEAVKNKMLPIINSKYKGISSDKLTVELKNSMYATYRTEALDKMNGYIKTIEELKAKRLRDNQAYQKALRGGPKGLPQAGQTSIYVPGG